MSIDLDLSDPINQVRMTIGDVESPFILDDSVIQYILTENNDKVFEASIQSLRYIVAFLGKKVNQEVGDTKVAYGDLLKNYKRLLEDLLTNPSMSSNLALHKIGGTTKSEIRRVRNHSETPHKSFRDGFFTEVQEYRLDPDNPYLFER